MEILGGLGSGEVLAARVAVPRARCRARARRRWRSVVPLAAHDRGTPPQGPADPEKCSTGIRKTSFSSPLRHAQCGLNLPWRSTAWQWRDTRVRVSESKLSSASAEPPDAAVVASLPNLPASSPVASMALVAMLAAALVLCSADRVIMSVAIVPLSAANGWSPTTAGIVQSSFLWGYALTPVLGGSLADAVGGHPVLACGMALWSAATLLTPWAATSGAPGLGAAADLRVLLLVRAVMGLGEGVAMPCMNNLVSRYVPSAFRASAVALCFVGFHLGCMLGLISAPALMTLPASSMGPQLHAPAVAPSIAAPFLFFGAVGFVWLGLWLLLGRLLPEQIPHPSSKARENDELPRKARVPPFKMLLSKPATWAIICANAVNNWGYFVLLSWMPVYFKQVMGVDLRQAAWFSALPWAVMAATSVVAGSAADLLSRAGIGTTAIRKIMQTIGFLGPACALLALSAVSDARAAVVMLAAALGLSSFSQAGFLLNYRDIAPNYVGVLHGISNTAGTLAGILSTIATGSVIQVFGSFNAVLMLTSSIYILGTIVWLIASTGEVVFPEPSY